MSEPDQSSRQSIPEHLMLSRLAQSDQMRDFFIQMWIQNPELARQGGSKVQSLLRPLMTESATIPKIDKQRGFSLIEVIMFIVIISVALAGILLVMNNVTGHSADTMLRKQALAAAESMLEEIELRDYIAASAVSTVTQANRATAYHVVSDYDGFSTTGITTASDAAGTPITGLSNYNLAVSVTPGALGPIAAASAVLITVTVTDPAGGQTVLNGYRTAY